MPATRASSRAVFGILLLGLATSISTYPQSAESLHSTFFNVFLKASSTGKNHRTNSGAWLAKCVAPPADPIAMQIFFSAYDSSDLSNRSGEGLDAGNVPDVACAAPNDSVLPRISPGDPCRGIGADHGAVPCNEFGDTVGPHLTALGKEGAKIERAREAVEDILRGSNACTEWFGSKDVNPAETVHSLEFLIDRKGPQLISESQVDGSSFLVRQPYVAQATQDGGAHTAITINAYGAFYRSQGNVERPAFPGGPLEGRGTHYLTVGSYPGDTLEAQMVTLLHELGHIINLLPEDADNLDGQSVRNTNEVLRHCRAEIEDEALQVRRRNKRQPDILK